LVRATISTRDGPRSVRASHHPALQFVRGAVPRLPFLDQDSVANVQGLGSIPTMRLERKLGRLSSDVMAKLKRVLAFVLDLSSVDV
jgi:mRNA-degrading endonuclease toxin of MazEF toxin-antitoxin module